jgi:hypothetical protein
LSAAAIGAASNRRGRSGRIGRLRGRGRCCTDRPRDRVCGGKW